MSGGHTYSISLVEIGPIFFKLSGQNFQKLLFISGEGEGGGDMAGSLFKTSSL